MTRRITPQTSLENLKKEAKRRLRAAEQPASLREIQLALAREYGFSGWTELKLALDRSSQARAYEQLASDLVIVYENGDSEALRRINRHYQRSSTVEDIRAMAWALIYKVRRAKGAADAFQIPEAQEMIARVGGYHNWTALTEAVANGDPPPVPAYEIDAKENTVSPQRVLSNREWDQLIGMVAESRISSIDARGFMTNDALKRIAALEHVTALRMEGCREIDDEGLQILARMPQLEHLDLSAGNITDRGLEILRHLPNLRSFKMVWQRGISDAGTSNLRYCEKIERVEMMGSPVGDGLIGALRSKPNLYHLETGRLVTDRGLEMLLEIPLLRTRPREARLLIDGPFTDDGFAKLAALEGVTALDLFWHATAITANAFATLPGWANLESLGCDGELANDVSMRHIGRIPRLRKLRAQGSAASDDGFAALSASQSLEELWGREAPGLTGRGFKAFATMPRLGALGISCARVEDHALSALPDFPALRKLTPIDFADDGFRHVGRCSRLEDLSCMYCRATTDSATAHIAGLRPKRYYAGLTLITDRSLEILGTMDSLESVELFETKSVTDAGLPHLAALRNLREVAFSGIPQVSFPGTAVFPAHVRVRYHA